MRHHYIPQFLLRRWCGKDGRLAAFEWKASRLVLDWPTPAYTGYEPRLYSLSVAADEDQDWLEREIMTKHVDTPAAPVLDRLINGDLSKLDGAERTAWTRFILAQELRVPDKIAYFREQGRTEVLRVLEENPEEYLACKGDAEQATLTDWVNDNVPGLDELVVIGRVLPGLLNHEGLGGIIINMHWHVIDIAKSKLDLLISDRPLLRFGALRDPNCSICMPLDPHRLFVATHTARSFKGVRVDRVTRESNRSTVIAAHRRVYSTGAQHRPLIEKYLTRPLGE